MQVWVSQKARVLLDMAFALLRYVGDGREVQSAAYNLIKDWSLEEHSYLRENVPKMGIRTPFRDGTLQDVALKVRNPMLPLWDWVLLSGKLHSAACRRAACTGFNNTWPAAIEAQLLLEVGLNLSWCIGGGCTGKAHQGLNLLHHAGVGALQARASGAGKVRGVFPGSAGCYCLQRGVSWGGVERAL
jgi:hypothetical protein